MTSSPSNPLKARDIGVFPHSSTTVDKYTTTDVATLYGEKPPDGDLADLDLADLEVFTPSFKRHLQRGFEKDPPNPDAFAELPQAVIDEVGLNTHKGARLDLMVLAHHLRADRESSRSDLVQYEQGFVVALGEDEYVMAMQTTAEDAYARLTGITDRSDLEDVQGRRLPDFERFYRRILYGTVWKLGRLKEYCVPAAAYACAVGGIQAAFLDEHPGRYRLAEACVSKRNRGRYLDHQSWNETVAEAGTDQDRHTSIGAFSTAFADETTPCTVPFVVLEVEAPDIVEAHEGTHRLLETLALDVDLSQVIVAYSGNKSFHVRLAHGLFGKPVYASADCARMVIGRFAESYTDETLDTSLFDPRHLIRMIGSKHERGLYCTAFYGDRFLEMRLHEITSAAQAFQPFALPDPSAAAVAAPLRLALEEAALTLERFYVPDFDDVASSVSGGAIRRALQGCEEGEGWHDKHIGRNKLIFVAACHFLRHATPAVAWAQVLEVNRRNSPPLPEREVKHCFKSARRTLQRNAA